MVAVRPPGDHPLHGQWSTVGWAGSERSCSLAPVPTVLLATDADWILDEVDAALSDASTTVYRVRRGIDVLEAIDQVAPDLVILDEQIGNMGGMATLSAVRNAEGVDRIPITAVLVLLDRAHDAFLARRHDADGYLVKPLDSIRLRRAADVLLAGDAYEEPLDLESGQPADITIEG
jgi:DNA-binding response OmpR family regulator